MRARMELTESACVRGGGGRARRRREERGGGGGRHHRDQRRVVNVRNEQVEDCQGGLPGNSSRPRQNCWGVLVRTAPSRAVVTACV